MNKYNRLNNKGYILVEIILASVLAMGIAYFMTDLTIKLKNKNDDLLVRTLVSTDQAIIYNTIMKDLYENGSSFTCDKIKIENNKFLYDGDIISFVSEYADIKYDASNSDSCNIDASNQLVYIKISVDVKQLEDDFSIVINHKYDKESITPDEENPSPGPNPSSGNPSLPPSPNSSNGSGSSGCSCSEFALSGLPILFEVGDLCYCCPKGFTIPDGTSCAVFFRY